MNFRILLLLVFASFFACTSPGEKELEARKNELSEKAKNINDDFEKIRLEAKSLAFEIETLYQKQDSILPTIDKSKYQMAANGIFMKPTNDGGSAVFVSGVTPVNEEIKNIVYFTEPIEESLKSLVNQYPEIVQAYYNDKYSYNRIYPFFDVLSQYEAKMNIPEFNFYYLADKEHDPKRKSCWVNEPYVDPAGRGWMVSAIAPVYFNDSLVGVPGIDITINTITSRYILDEPESMLMIVDNTGNIVAAQDVTINLLSFPPLTDHKYIETIKQDSYQKETYNMKLSKEENVRKIGVEILDEKKEQVETNIDGNPIRIIVEHIPELEWYLLEIID